MMEFKLHCWDCGKKITDKHVKFTRHSGYEEERTESSSSVICYPCWRVRKEDTKADKRKHYYD